MKNSKIEQLEKRREYITSELLTEFINLFECPFWKLQLYYETRGSIITLNRELGRINSDLNSLYNREIFEKGIMSET